MHAGRPAWPAGRCGRARRPESRCHCAGTNCAAPGGAPITTCGVPCGVPAACAPIPGMAGSEPAARCCPTFRRRAWKGPPDMKRRPGGRPCLPCFAGGGSLLLFFLLQAAAHVALARFAALVLAHVLAALLVLVAALAALLLAFAELALLVAALVAVVRHVVPPRNGSWLDGAPRYMAGASQAQHCAALVTRVRKRGKTEPEAEPVSGFTPRTGVGREHSRRPNRSFAHDPNPPCRGTACRQPCAPSAGRRCLAG